MCFAFVLVDEEVRFYVHGGGLGPGGIPLWSITVMLKWSCVVIVSGGGGSSGSTSGSPRPPSSDPPLGSLSEMRKPVASSLDVQDGKPVHLAALDSPLFLQFPSLMKHMAVTRYDDQSPRYPGTVIMRTEGSTWKVILKDPSTALQLLVAATTWDDALALAELLLGAEKAPWEADPNAWLPGTKSKKRS